MPTTQTTLQPPLPTESNKPPPPPGNPPSTATNVYQNYTSMPPPTYSYGQNQSGYDQNKTWNQNQGWPNKGYNTSQLPPSNVNANLQSTSYSNVNTMPNMSNMPPNMSSMPPTISGGTSNINNTSLNISNMPPNMNNLPPNMVNMPPNMSTMPPNISTVPPNMSNMPPNYSSNMPPSNKTSNVSSTPQNLPSNVASNQNKRQYSQSDTLDCKRGKFEHKPKEKNPNQSEIDELSESEKKFMKQFALWEAQFNRWKDQNANHPDKTQYREYEKKWETWRAQLLERREQMRRKRLGLMASQSQFESQTSSNQTNALTSPSDQNKAWSLNKPPLLPTPDEQTVASIFGKPPSESDKSENESFLKSSSSGGIPGLDLVKESTENDPNLDDNNSKPDLDAISKGLNSILGDQNLMNIISKVSQSQGAATVSTLVDIGPKIGVDQLLLGLSNDSSNFIEERSNQEQISTKQGETFSNLDEQTRLSFGGNFEQSKEGSTGFGLGSQMISQYGSFENQGNDSFNRGHDSLTRGPETFNKGLDSFNRGPDSFNNNRASESLNRGSDFFNRGSDTFNRGSGSISKGPESHRLPDVFNTNPGHDLFNKNSDSFNRSSESFSRGPDSFSRGSETFGRDIETFNKGPESLNKGCINFNRVSDFRNRGPDYFNRGHNSFNRGSGSFNKSPDIFNRGSDSFNRGPDAFNKDIDHGNFSTNSPGKIPGLMDNFRPGKVPDFMNKNSGNLFSGRSRGGHFSSKGHNRSDSAMGSKRNFDISKGGMDEEEEDSSLQEDPFAFDRDEEGNGENENRLNSNFSNQTLDGSISSGDFKRPTGIGVFNRGRDSYGSELARRPEDFNRPLRGFSSSPEEFNRGPRDFNRGSNDLNRGFGDFNRNPDDFNVSPGDYNRGSEDFNKGSGDFNRRPREFNRRPGDFNRRFVDFNRDPEDFSENSRNFNRRSRDLNTAPSRFNRSPGDFNKSARNLNKNPSEATIGNVNKVLGENLNKSLSTQGFESLNNRPKHSNAYVDERSRSFKPEIQNKEFLNDSVDNLNQNPNFIEGPPLYNQAPPNFNRAPPNFNQDSSTFSQVFNFNRELKFNQGFPNFNQCPPDFKAGANFKRSPSFNQGLNFNNDPNFNQGLPNFNQYPPNVNKGPNTHGPPPNFREVLNHTTGPENIFNLRSEENQNEKALDSTQETEQIWKCETIIDYDHNSKVYDYDVAIYPKKMFDYRHKSVNRIPLPERPKWLADFLRPIPEFDPIIGRPPSFFERIPTSDRYDSWRTSRTSYYLDYPEDGLVESRMMQSNDKTGRKLSERIFTGIEGRERYDERKRDDERKFGDKKYWDRKFNDYKFGDKCDDRTYGDKNYNDQKYGDKKYDDQKYGDKRYDKERFEVRNYNDEWFGDRKSDDEKFRDTKYDDQKHEDERFKNRKLNDEKYVDGWYDDQRHNRKYDDCKREDRNDNDHKLDERIFEEERKITEKRFTESRHNNDDHSKELNFDEEKRKIDDFGGRKGEWNQEPQEVFDRNIRFKNIKGENIEVPMKKLDVTKIEELINPPGRFTRPARLVIILRGPPGSGKTHLAKLIKDKEVNYICLFIYFKYSYSYF